MRARLRSFADNLIRESLVVAEAKEVYCNGVQSFDIVFLSNTLLLLLGVILSIY